MSGYGVLGAMPRVTPYVGVNLRWPFKGLGAYATTIPQECWNQTNFKTCNAAQYVVAKAVCQGKGQDNDDCIGPLADQYTMSACKCTKSTAKPKQVVVTPKPGDTLEVQESTGFMGMDSQTIMLVAVASVGIYLFMGSKKKGSKS